MPLPPPLSRALIIRGSGVSSTVQTKGIGLTKHFLALLLHLHLPFGATIDHSANRKHDQVFRTEVHRVACEPYFSVRDKSWCSWLSKLVLCYATCGLCNHPSSCFTKVMNLKLLINLSKNWDQYFEKSSKLNFQQLIQHHF